MQPTGNRADQQRDEASIENITKQGVNQQEKRRQPQGEGNYVPEGQCAQSVVAGHHHQQCHQTRIRESVRPDKRTFDRGCRR